MKGLERTTLRPKDISEQPDSKFVMIVGGESAAAIAVDDWRILNGEVIGYSGKFNVKDDDRIVAYPADAAWLILRRDYVETQTREQYLRGVHEDAEAAEALSKELDPRGERSEPRGRMPIIMLSGDGEDGPAPADNRPMPMQYL